MLRFIMNRRRRGRAFVETYGFLHLSPTTTNRYPSLRRTLTINTSNITPTTSFSSIPSLIQSLRPPPSDDDKIEEEAEGSDHEAEHHHHQEPEIIQEIHDQESEIRANLPLVPTSQILSGIPQNPYYHHRLHRYSELTQRNLAAAWNRTFEDTAKQIQELNKEKSWTRVPDLWKTMGEMQGMGYNVLPMRRRLLKMAELREKMKEEELTMKELMDVDLLHRFEKAMLEPQMLKLQIQNGKKKEEELEMEEEIIQLLEKGMVENEMYDLEMKKREKDVDIERVKNGIDRSREKILEYDDAIKILAMKPLIDDS